LGRSFAVGEYIIIYCVESADVFILRVVRACAEIFITGAPDVREGGEKRETAGDRVNQARSNIHAGAFLGDVKPDVIQISFGPWR
jgi:hypothetical protein